ALAGATRDVADREEDMLDAGQPPEPPLEAGELPGDTLERPALGRGDDDLELTLVVARQEVLLDRAEEERSRHGAEPCRGADRPAPPEGEPERRQVGPLVEPGERARRAARLGAAAQPEEARAEHRRQRQPDAEREQDRDRERDPEALEEAADHAL